MVFDWFWKRRTIDSAENQRRKYGKICSNSGKEGKSVSIYKACDIYLQPSRYEGKAVTVREAQILNKPVIITNYATSNSQLQDGIDGVIVPKDIAGCSKGIIQVVNDKRLQQRLIENTKIVDYTNSLEVEKIYCLMR